MPAIDPDVTAGRRSQVSWLVAASLDHGALSLSPMAIVSSMPMALSWRTANLMSHPNLRQQANQ